MTIVSVSSISRNPVILPVPGTAPGGVPGTPGNPTAQITTTAVNGSSASFMRADAAPALAQTLGGGTFAPTTNYGPGVDVSGTVQIEVQGSIASPTTNAGAVFAVQKNSAVIGEIGNSNPNPAAYFSLTKNTSGIDRGCAIFAEAIDSHGSNQGFIEGIRTHAVLTGGTAGEAYGIVATAAGVGITYTEMICAESQLFQQSGVDAPATFNGSAPPTLSVGFLTENDGANFADVAFLVNPYANGKFRRGFVVGNNSVDQTAFASYATTVIGLDLASGTQSFSAISLPNNTPVRITNGANSSALNVMFLGTSNNLVLGADANSTVIPNLSLLTATITLANGLNSNIAVTTSRVQISGPSAAFSIGGFSHSSSLVDGQRLVVYNDTTNAMTIVNEDASSTAADRINTLTGANVTLRTGRSCATFSYGLSVAGLGPRWILESTN